jgi:hypothetical protein
MNVNAVTRNFMLPLYQKWLRRACANNLPITTGEVRLGLEARRTMANGLDIRRKWPLTGMPVGILQVGNFAPNYSWLRINVHADNS